MVGMFFGIGEDLGVAPLLKGREGAPSHNLPAAESMTAPLRRGHLLIISLQLRT